VTGIGLQVDALRLLFLVLFLLPDPLGGGGRTRRQWLGLGVCRLGLVVTALAGSTWIALGGSALAALGLGCVAGQWRWGSTLAPLLLLPVALHGGFDGRPAPGQPLTPLPVALVLCALGAAILALDLPLLWRSVRSSPLVTADPTPSLWPAALYAVGAGLPLLISLAAGPWDALSRWVALAVGLALLGGAGGAAWRATTAAGALRALASYVLGLLILALGIGSAGAVGGALLALASALVGSALLSAGGSLRWVALAAFGLPPALGFTGLWLLLGATLVARFPLATLAVPGSALLVAAALARTLPGRAGLRPWTWLGACGLLLAGLLPGVVLDGALRPALNTLAVGLPALADLHPAPGLGLLIVRGSATTASWPAFGVAAALLLTLAGAEALARLHGLFPHRRDDV